MCWAVRERSLGRGGSGPILHRLSLTYFASSYILRKTEVTFFVQLPSRRIWNSEFPLWFSYTVYIAFIFLLCLNRVNSIDLRRFSVDYLFPTLYIWTITNCRDLATLSLCRTVRQWRSLHAWNTGIRLNSNVLGDYCIRWTRLALKPNGSWHKWNKSSGTGLKFYY